MTRRLALLCLLGVSAMLVSVPTAAAGGGCHPPTDLEMSTGSRPVVGIGQCAFIDTVVHIEPGEEVRWVNKDPVPHTVTGAAFSWGSERILDQGDEVAYTFEDEGVYPYYCALHPSMVGAVVVGDPAKPAALTNGAAAVTDTTEGVVAAGQDAEPASKTSTGTSAAIGAAIFVTIALVVFATRALTLRRREPFVTPAP